MFERLGQAIDAAVSEILRLTAVIRGVRRRASEGAESQSGAPEKKPPVAAIFRETIGQPGPTLPRPIPRPTGRQGLLPEGSPLPRPVAPSVGPSAAGSAPSASWFQPAFLRALITSTALLLARYWPHKQGGQPVVPSNEPPPQPAERGLAQSILTGLGRLVGSLVGRGPKGPEPAGPPPPSGQAPPQPAERGLAQSILTGLGRLAGSLVGRGPKGPEPAGPPPSGQVPPQPAERGLAQSILAGLGRLAASLVGRVSRRPDSGMPPITVKEVVSRPQPETPLSIAPSGPEKVKFVSPPLSSTAEVIRKEAAETRPFASPGPEGIERPEAPQVVHETKAASTIVGPTVLDLDQMAGINAREVTRLLSGQVAIGEETLQAIHEIADAAKATAQATSQIAQRQRQQGREKEAEGTEGEMAQAVQMASQVGGLVSGAAGRGGSAAASAARAGGQGLGSALGGLVKSVGGIIGTIAVVGVVGYQVVRAISALGQSAEAGAQRLRDFAERFRDVSPAMAGMAGYLRFTQMIDRARIAQQISPEAYRLMQTQIRALEQTRELRTLAYVVWLRIERYWSEFKTTLVRPFNDLAQAILNWLGMGQQQKEEGKPEFTLPQQAVIDALRQWAQNQVRTPRRPIGPFNR